MAVDIKPPGFIGQAGLRFNWNTPIALSPHDPKVIYVGSQQLHRSADRGDPVGAEPGV